MSEGKTQCCKISTQRQEFRISNRIASRHRRDILVCLRRQSLGTDSVDALPVNHASRNRNHWPNASVGPLLRNASSVPRKSADHSRLYNSTGLRQSVQFPDDLIGLCILGVLPVTRRRIRDQEQGRGRTYVSKRLCARCFRELMNKFKVGHQDDVAYLCCEYSVHILAFGSRIRCSPPYLARVELLRSPQNNSILQPSAVASPSVKIQDAINPSQSSSPKLSPKPLSRSRLSRRKPTA